MARTSQKRSLWGRLRGAYRAFVEPLSGGILPLSTGGVKIQKGQSVQITGTPWGDPWWRPEGLFIAPKDVTDWIVNDIKIADRSQFVQAGDIPGEMFVSKEIGTFVRFQPVQRGQKIDVVVTYIGDNPEGCSFTGAMSGMVYDPSLIQTILESLPVRDFMSEVLTVISAAIRPSIP